MNLLIDTIYIALFATIPLVLIALKTDLYTKWSWKTLYFLSIIIVNNRSKVISNTLLYTTICLLVLYIYLQTLFIQMILAPFLVLIITRCVERLN